MDRARSRVKVKGVAMLMRHIKPSEADPKGGRVRREGTLHVSNVAHIDPETKKATRTGVRMNKEGAKELFAKRSGKVLRMVK